MGDLYLLESAGEAAIDRICRVARDDFATFLPLVGRERKGRPLTLSAIHRCWIAHQDFCASKALHDATFAPWGHGKSTVLVVLRAAWELGRDPSLRIKFVSNVEKKARERVAAVGRILESPAYRRIFPWISSRTVTRDMGPRRVGKRVVRKTQDFILVNRPGDSLDMSVEACSIFSAGMGGRADRLFFDDIVDQTNAIDHPGERERVTEDFESVWMSRIDPPEGRASLVGTMWHVDDHHHKLLDMPAWVTLRQAISADMTRIEQEVYNMPEGYPLPVALPTRRPRAA